MILGPCFFLCNVCVLWKNVLEELMGENAYEI